MKKEKINLKPRLLIAGIIFFIGILGSVFYYFYHTNRHEIKETNVKYGNNTMQTLNLFTPKVQNKKKLPVIIYVHGVGWSGGDKTSVSQKPDYFNKQGYAFISVNHRLSPEVSYEEMTNDISNAIKWVYDNADKYHLDRTQINLMGHSAGGHLIMLIATNPKYLNNVGLSSNVIRSTINIDGPLDLVSFIGKFERYNKVFGKDQKIWEEASPVTYATNKNLSPVFLIARDKTSVETFINKMQKSGNNVRYFESKTLSHSELTRYLGTSQNSESTNMTNAILEFLKNH
ncbi:alpha/beta hydrolase [Bacillus thuringiensis]|uniref:alpha/beta hydrolase n=1 Tax=Bacillus thuringiensis TaxID=1428 RepID=UPI00234F1A63|nr:alpha/beta hydrolase [Bacillus thuringiensis]MDC7735395.1 alpha/beta hydrolase [Bacillus thuringiensis]HDR8196691.1 alpha/beta hydrolase [Bacillus thuringiensis]